MTTALGTERNQLRWSDPTLTHAFPDDLERVKSWLNIDSGNTTGDEDVVGYMNTAMSYIERVTRRQLLTATFTLYADKWQSEFELDRKLPIASVDSIKYYTTDNVLTTLSTDDYEVSITSPNKPARIRPVDGATWPTIDDRYDAIQIAITAGYGDHNSIPFVAKAAIRYLCANQEEFRESLIAGTIIAKVPATLEAALASLSWGSYP